MIDSARPNSSQTAHGSPLPCIHSLATVTTIGLNLHKAPSLRSAVIDQLAQGDRVAILSRTIPNGSTIALAEVKVMRTRSSVGQGEIGWVRADLLEPERQSLRPAPPADAAAAPIAKRAVDPARIGKLAISISAAGAVIALAAWLAGLI